MLGAEFVVGGRSSWAKRLGAEFVGGYVGPKFFRGPSLWGSSWAEILGKKTTTRLYVFFFIQQPKCNMILNSLQFHLYTRHKQIKSDIPFSKWRNTNEKIFILQTVLIVIKLFALFTTYNQETGWKNVVPDTKPFQ